MPNSAQSHERQAAQFAKTRPVSCAVLSVSDTRTAETDTSGKLIEELLRKASHRVVHRTIVPDEPGQIEEKIYEWLNDSNVNVILTTGGTGIGRRDTTIDVVQKLLTVELEGFGELFRTLSYNQVGSSAMLSRAVGGLVIRDSSGDETFVFAMPGSMKAVTLAMTDLIIPQLAHLVWERAR